MDTRERVESAIESWILAKPIGHFIPDLADAILAIFAEEREHLMQRVAHFKSDLALEEMSGRRLREALLARAEKAEAREAKLVEWLKKAWEWIDKTPDTPSRRIADEIDAALASAPVSWGVKITLIDPPAEGFSGGHDEPATPRDAAKEEKV